MWEELQSQVLREAGTYAWRIVAALIVLAIGIWLAKLLRNYLYRLLTARKLDSTVVYFADNCVQVVLYGVVIIAVLHRLGIETNALVAILGAAGLAIGLGMKGQLSNVASGLLIILFRPFSVGNYIEGGGTAGTVEKIQLMSTEVSRPDNVTVIIPNSKLTSEKVVNYSVRDTRRLDIVVGVSYKADLKKVRDVLQGLIEKEHVILKEPEPSINIKELADKSVKIELDVWVRSEDYYNAKAQLNEKIKECYDSEEIPFP